MSKITKKKVIISVSIAVSVLLVVFLDKKWGKEDDNLTLNYRPVYKVERTEEEVDKIKESLESKEREKNKPKDRLLAISSNDIVLGNLDAPITIIEYSSLSCPHCANFYNQVFKPHLKPKYIDKGIVKFVHRDFPLNRPAVIASMVAKCMANNSVKGKKIGYYEFIEKLFKSQNKWAFSDEYAKHLKNLSLLNELKESQFDECIKDLSLEEEVLISRLNAANILGITSTPTFIINGTVHKGYLSLRKIEAIIKLLNK